MEQYRDDTKLYVVMFEDSKASAVSEIFLSPILAKLYKEKYQKRAPHFRYYIVQMLLYDNHMLRNIRLEFMDE